MTTERDPQFLAVVAESDVALNLYLSGLSSGACSAMLNWSGESPDVARARGTEMITRVLSDPVATAQIVNTIRDIVYGTETAPRDIFVEGDPA